MFEEHNTGNNLPAQFDLFATEGNALSSCLWPKARLRE